MRAFVTVRALLIHQTDLKEQLKELRDRINEHDVELMQIYDAIENLLDENAVKKNGLKRTNWF
jgi:hypothetical protein